MFNNTRKFLSLFRGAFFANLLPMTVYSGPETPLSPAAPKAGKGKGRRGHSQSNAAAHKRAAQKRKGVALNKARHAG